MAFYFARLNVNYFWTVNCHSFYELYMASKNEHINSNCYFFALAFANKKPRIAGLYL